MLFSSFFFSTALDPTGLLRRRSRVFASSSSSSPSLYRSVPACPACIRFLQRAESRRSSARASVRHREISTCCVNIPAGNLRTSPATFLIALLRSSTFSFRPICFLSRILVFAAHRRCHNYFRSRRSIRLICSSRFSRDYGKLNNNSNKKISAITFASRRTFSAFTTKQYIIFTHSKSSLTVIVKII